MDTLRGLIVAALPLALACGSSTTQPAPAEEARGREPSPAAMVVCEAPWASGSAELDAADLARLDRDSDYLVAQGETYPEIGALFGRLAESGPRQRGALIRQWAHERGMTRCRYADVSDFFEAPAAHVASAVLLRVEGTDVLHQMERLGALGDARLGARIEALFGEETSALLVIAEDATFGALRDVLRLARAHERRLPLYLRSRWPVEGVDGTVSMSARLDDLTLASLAARRREEPLRLSFFATRDGIVVSAGAAFQPPGCDVLLERGPDAPRPAIAPPSSEDARVELEECLLALTENREAGVVWIGGTAEVPAAHVVWLGDALGQSEALPAARVHLSLADPFWLEGR